MNTIIALLRGINVGGHNKLPMRDLAALLAGLGLANVESYIQSGNVVFQSEQALGVAATARNWRTVRKILEIGTAVSS